MAPIITPGSGRGIDFGLIFFSSNEAPFSGEKYRLVIESTKYADKHGFSSIWIPERHFTKDGWLYPNPAVLQAALARETSRIQLRAGSVVMPLHNPLRVAEEWAMVDNLSGGRVGISFASGWHPNDFALMPENYAQRNEEMYRGIDTVRRLWRGEGVQMRSGDGSMVELRTYPEPLQPELPFWVTAAGNPKTFAGAGAIGANLLTHMYNQSVDELAAKIRIYRESRADHGYDPQTGIVSVMLHTFVGATAETVHAQLVGPFTEYLKSASYLVNAIAASRGQKVDLSTLSEQDLQDYLQFVFDRLVSTQRVLFGTPESCLDLVVQMKLAGVDEVACQMDFGVESELVLASLPHLTRLQELSNAELTRLQATGSASANTPPPYHLNGHKPATPGSEHVQALQADQLSAVQQRCLEEVVLSTFYQRLYDRGIQLGTRFQNIEQLWRRDGEALGKIRLDNSLRQEADLYQMHPTLLDASLQVMIATLPAALSAQDDALYLPTAIGQLQFLQHGGSQLWSHARLKTQGQPADGIYEGDVHILDLQGQLVARIDGLQLQRSEPISRSASRPDTEVRRPQVVHKELHDWLYELQWKETTLPSVPAAVGTQQGTWLVFMDKQGVGEHLCQYLEELETVTIKVVAGNSYKKLASSRYQVNPRQPEDVQRVLQDIHKNSPYPLRHIVHLWSLDATPSASLHGAALAADQITGSGTALHIMQALISSISTDPPRLWLVTQGAQPVAPQDTATLAVAQSPLWGLGKTCAMEQPEIWGGMIDIDPQGTKNIAAAQIRDVVLSEQNEDQLAFRQGHCYVARMVRSQVHAAAPLNILPNASYLITGGLWGLGLEVAHWLVEKGAGHLVLVGRSKLPPRGEWDQVAPDTRLAQQIAGVRSLEQRGAQVHYASLDVSDEEQLSTFFASFNDLSMPPIRGVMHAASVWQDPQGQSLVRPLANSNLEALQAVFQPKVLGSWLLQSLLQDTELDFFVSFSSGASLFGSAAQGNYAAAGEFMDVLAHYQRAHGQPAISIDWGAVSSIGFGATADGLRVHEYWESHGIQRITPTQVLAALDLLIPQEQARVGVIKLDWPLLQQFYPQITRLPLVSGLITQSAEGEDVQLKDTSTLQALRSAGEAERALLLTSYLRAQVANVLRMPVARLDVEQPLTALGLNSLMAIELKNRIELELEVRIPIVTFLQGPSITQFSAQVLEQLTAMLQAESAAIQELPPASPAEATHNTQLSVSEQDADALLGQLDQLSDQDVEALLSQMLEADAVLDQPTNGYHSPPADVSPQDAAQLLAQLDQLSEEQVDSLLSQLSQKEE